MSRLFNFVNSLFFLVFLTTSYALQAQVAIGTTGTSPTPNPKAVLLLTGANQGFIIPIVNSKGSVNATATEKGMVVFDDSDKKVYFFDGTAWNQVGGGSGGSQSISINGNLIQLSGSPVSSFPLASSAGPAANQNGQLLMWNQTNSRWEATANTPTATNGMVLTWNGTTNTWEPKAPSAVSSTPLPNGQFFVGNASNVATATAPSTFPFSNFGAATAPVSLGNNKITNLATPTVPTDAANKAYVDANVLPLLSASQLLSNNGSNVGITAAGDLTLSVTGTTGTFTIASNAVTNVKLAGSIAASKLIGTDINTVGTITSGVWNGTKVSEAFGGTNQITYATGDILYASASNILSKLPIGAANQVLTVNAGLPVWSAGVSGWALGGNIGTVDGAIGTGTNYIGTKDNVPLNFLMNNQRAGRIDNVNASTFFGSVAGSLNTGGQNAGFGSQALEKNVGGGSNAAFGQLSLNNNTTGNYNVAVGAIAMTSNTTGGNNIAIGVQSNNNNTTGSGNTAIGYNANFGNISSGFNTIVGIDAAFNNTGANNTALGRQALFTNTTGSNNTAVGYKADVAATVTNATAIGANASATTSNTIQLGDALVTTVNIGTGTTAKLVAGGLQITGGTLGVGKVLTSDAAGLATWQAGGSGWALGGNTGTVDGVVGTGTNYIGTKDNVPLNFVVNNLSAGRIESAAGTANTLFGYQAGSVNTGIQNAAVGYQAMQNNTAGQRNAAFGYHALLNNTTGNGNTGAGQNALSLNTTGGANAAFGTSALANNTGSTNTAVGNSALTSNTTASDNVAVGTQSLSFNTIGASNSALGSASLINNTTGSNNTAVGLNALQTNTTSNFNTALGYKADVSSAAFTNATAIGANALVTGSNIIQLGDLNVTTVNVGTGTTAKLVAGSLQITGGTLGAGKVLTSDATGNATWQSGGSGWIPGGNTGTIDGAVGTGTNYIGTKDNVPLNLIVNNQKAGRIEPATPFGTFFGFEAGLNNGVAQGNVAVGYQALQSFTSASNTAIGYQAMKATSGGQNTSLGYAAMQTNTTGTGNTAVGSQALANQLLANYNTAIGLSVMQFATGNSNTAIGAQAAAFNSSGTNNVFLGYQAGYPLASVANSNTTGSNNTFVGTNTGLSAGAQVSGSTAIGYNARVDASNALILGGTGVDAVNVGIGTTSPTQALDVNGNALIGSAAVNNIGLIIRGPNSPVDANSAQDISFSFSSAGSSRIRSYRGSSWDTYLQFLTNASAQGSDNPQIRMHISENGNVGIGTTSPSNKLEVQSAGTAIFGQSSGSTTAAVYGYNGNTGGTLNRGVYGQADGVNAHAVEGYSLSGFAGYFNGKVTVTGTLSKGAGTFKIDHPQDPENKYLYHSFVESPDMMNVYNGNISTNSEGLAVVSLPNYFESLNKDFRYQLTVLGEFAQAIIFKKVEGNVFIIKTDKPNIEVSWQVTGIRKDPFAEKNRIIPEVNKTGAEKGKYLHPEAYGLPVNKGLYDKPIKENN